jgi:hypothetical protein
MFEQKLVIEDNAVSMNDLLSAFKSDPLEEFDVAPEHEIEMRAESDMEPSFFRTEQTERSLDDLSNVTKIRLREVEEPEENHESELTTEQPGFDLNLLFDFFLERLKEENLLPVPSEINSLDSQRDTHGMQRVSPLAVNDRTEELNELKSLLVQAQETIIKLLTDRVEDKAKIATMEAQLKYLPLQHLGDANAIQIRNEQDQLKLELASVKHELQKTELAKMRNSMDLDSPKRSFFARLFGRIAG